jgi:uncharacterized protein
MRAFTEPDDACMFNFGALELSIWQWGLLGLCAFMVGLSKTGMPGVGILAVLLAAMVIPAKASVGLVLPLLIFADVFAAAYYHRKARWNHIVRLIGFTLIGIIVAAATLKKINDRQLSLLIGLIVLGLLAVSTWNNSRQSAAIHYDHANALNRWIFAAVFGFLAGYTTMMANAAGPIMIVYLLAVGLPKYEFVGTTAWFFFIANWLKVPFQQKTQMITAESLKIDVYLFPIVIVGALAGILLVRYIPQKVFNTIVTLIAAGAAAWMVASYFVVRPL